MRLYFGLLLPGCLAAALSSGIAGGVANAQLNQAITGPTCQEVGRFRPIDMNESGQVLGTDEIAEIVVTKGRTTRFSLPRSSGVNIPMFLDTQGRIVYSQLPGADADLEYMTLVTDPARRSVQRRIQMHVLGYPSLSGDVVGFRPPSADPSAGNTPLLGSLLTGATLEMQEAGLPAESWAAAISAGGLILAYSPAHGGRPSGYITFNRRTLQTQSLAIPGHCVPRGVNDFGDVVGECNDGATSFPFASIHGRVTNLRDVFGSGLGSTQINNQRMVLNSSRSSSGNFYRSALWNADLGMVIDLNREIPCLGNLTQSVRAVRITEKGDILVEARGVPNELPRAVIIRNAGSVLTARLE